MTNREKHSALVYGDVRIDIKQVVSGTKLKDFAINVSLLADHKRRDVFRVDTAHGHLHIQRFWISSKPEKVQNKKKDDYKGDFGNWKDKVLKNHEDYVKIYKKKFGLR